MTSVEFIVPSIRNANERILIDFPSRLGIDQITPQNLETRSIIRVYGNSKSDVQAAYEALCNLFWLYDGYLMHTEDLNRVEQKSPSSYWEVSMSPIGAIRLANSGTVRT